MAPEKGNLDQIAELRKAPQQARTVADGAVPLETKDRLTELAQQWEAQSDALESDSAN